MTRTRATPWRLRPVCGAVWLLASGAAGAAATTDGSMGAVQTLSGRFTVPQALGTQRGGNLFHSFARFGIAAGESATFTTTDPGVRHVIARVTGGEASTLQGPLALQAAAGSRPDFWLVNPGGIVVGAGASFDVPAGLHLSTAPVLRFGDGSSWDARSASGSSLSVAAPERFGFLGPAAALRWADADATLAAGSTLSLAGGDVQLERAQLAAPGGRVQVHAAGAVSVGPGGALYASAGPAAGSGAIAIDAAALTLDAAGSTAWARVESGPGLAAHDAGITLDVSGALQLLRGADVTASSASDAAVGALRVRAGSLRIDGAGLPTGLGSYAFGAAPGPLLALDVAGTAALVNGGQLFAATFGPGAGGALQLHAGSLLLDAADSFAFVGTQSLSGASGRTGALTVDVSGSLTARGASQITTQAVADGPAGPLAVAAGSVLLDGQGLGGSPGIAARGGGAVQVQVRDALELRAGAGISSFSHERHAAEPLQVQAARIVLDGGAADSAQIGSLSSSAQASAAVAVSAAESITLGRGGQINAASLGDGHAGPVRIQAPQVTLQGGGERVTLISSSAFGTERGNGGTVELQVRSLRVGGGAAIASESTAAQGDAGTVAVQAERVLLEGQGSASAIRSIAYGAAGNAGRVRVDASEALTILDGAAIVAGALGSGSPGEIVVAARSLDIDGRGNTTLYTGIAGDVLLNLGAGAAVRIDAGQVSLRDGGSISTSTYGAAAAGSVRLNADSLRVDGSGSGSATGISATSTGSGRAGDLLLAVRDITLTDDALLSTATLGRGAGGRVTVDATRLQMQRSAAIVSATGGSGAAGDVQIRVGGELDLREGAIVSANTAGAGAAGRIDIVAATFSATGVDPRDGLPTTVVSRAREGSSGRAGSVTIDVSGRLTVADGARVSSANAATLADPAAVAPGDVTLRGGSIHVERAEVTAAATGNVDAGRIRLEAAGDVRLAGAAVRSSALDGNGGPIAVTAGGRVQLRDSAITTSVEGTRNGNGGDIDVRASALVLQSGYVQANTRAPRARGGDVRIATDVLLPDGSHVFIGGSRIAEVRSGVPGLNVVQAAAPDGVSGTLAVTLPQLDLSGHLAALLAPPIDFGPLGADFCRVGLHSSLTRLGRGALEPAAAEPLSVRP